MDNKIYFYDYKYWTKEEISEMYQKLSYNKKKIFRDAIAHYALATILSKCNYDRSMIHTIWEIAGDEVDKMNLMDGDCGRPLLGYERLFYSKIRRLINLTGKLANDDSKINRFANGEWYVNDLVYISIGLSFEKDIIGDLFLIDCESLTIDECQAIADNFVRDMRGEEIIYYSVPRKIKK